MHYFVKNLVCLHCWCLFLFRNIFASFLCSKFMMISLCSVLLVSKVLYQSYDALLAIGFTWSSKWLAIHTPQEGKHMAHISLGYLHILCISLQHMTTFITFFLTFWLFYICKYHCLRRSAAVLLARSTVAMSPTVWGRGRGRSAGRKRAKGRS